MPRLVFLLRDWSMLDPHSSASSASGPANYTGLGKLFAVAERSPKDRNKKDLNLQVLQLLFHHGVGFTDGLPPHRKW